MEKEDIDKLYNAEEVEKMRVAENARLMGKNRIEEFKNFARLSGFKRIGIAHCIAFKKEAEKLAEELKKEFEVYAIDCYVGRIRTKELLGGDDRRFTCNPAGQAVFLANNNQPLTPRELAERTGRARFNVWMARLQANNSAR